MAETKTPIGHDPDKGPPYPLPWTLETKDGDNYIRDATGQAIACDMQYYPWIYSDAMPLIVRAVNSHRDLLDALRELVECCPFTPTPMGIKVYVTLAQTTKIQAAIRKANHP